MRVFSAAQMTEADRRTIEGGIPGIDLMRTAGEMVARVVEAIAEPGAAVVVVAGKGNNGGDGFCAAELLRADGYGVSVFVAADPEGITGDARICLDDYREAGGTIQALVSEVELGIAAETIQAADIIIDALFGTGLSGAVDGIAAEVIALVNGSEAIIVSVDIPSGVSATTGMVEGPAVEANHTVTFECMKAGQVLKPGALYCGDLHVAGIGLDEAVLDSIPPYGQTLTPPEARELFPSRRYDTHKFTAGHVLVLAGSAGMTGAAALSSMAALRSGAGYVTLGCPESLNDILEQKLTEILTAPVAEVRKKRCLSVRALGRIRELAARADVIAIGPGLGGYGETGELVRRFVLGNEGRIVLDADGITAFAGQAEKLAESTADIVLTPHTGELARLLDCDSATVVADPRQAALDAAVKTNAVVLLKGPTSIIADPAGATWFNPTGNEGMATAGAGDVLTGVIAGLAAQGMSLLDAAVLGSYLHGLAGDIAAEDKSAPGMIAGDILKRIPAALNEMLAESS